jgi:hypothetical protein
MIISLAQFAIGYICFYLFFEYFGINASVPLYKLHLMQIGTTPLFWTLLLCYPTFLIRYENKKRIKLIYIFISLLLLYSIYRNSFTEYRLYVLIFGCLANLIGFILRKKIYNMRFFFLALSLVAMICIFVYLYTFLRREFNVMNYNGDTYAITHVIGENAYFVRSDIEPNMDSNGQDIRLFRGDSLVINLYEENIVGYSRIEFSKVILEDQ